jgi:hypothetical protein
MLWICVRDWKLDEGLSLAKFLGIEKDAPTDKRKPVSVLTAFSRVGANVGVGKSSGVWVGLNPETLELPKSDSVLIGVTPGRQSL